MSALTRMKMLVDLAEQEVEKAALTLRELQSQQTFVNRQLNDLKAYLQEYVAKMTTSGQFFLPIQLQTTQAFIDKLNQAIANQHSQLAALDKNVEAAQAQWLDKRARYNALHKVYAKRLEQAQQLQAKQEQKAMDELSALRFGQGRGH
jgi:flagellar FliJ protein